MLSLLFVPRFSARVIAGVVLGVAAITQPVFAGADLVPQNVTATSSVVVGNSIVVTYDVRNIGDTDAPASHTRLQIRDQSGANVVTVTYGTGALAPNAVASDSRSVTIPVGSTPGAYTVRINVDFNLELPAGTTDNDVSATVPFTVLPAADLVPQNVTVSSSVVVGNSIVVTYDVRNIGNSAAPASHTRLQIRNQLGTTVVAETYATIALAPNAFVSDIRTITIPANAYPGAYSVRINVDFNLELPAGTTDNDTSASLPFTVLTAALHDADLLPQNVTTTSSVAAGKALAVNYEVRNQGGTAAPSSLTKIQIRNSSGVEIVSQTFVTTALDPNTIGPESRLVTIPANTPPGTYTAYVIVDSTSLVVQAGATGNDTSVGVAFTVEGGSGTLADLVPRSVAATSTVAAGGLVTVGYTVRNQGGTDAPVSHTQVQVTNSAGVEVASQVFITGGIVANSFVTESRLLAIPAAAAPGTYTAFVIVDHDREVAQGDATGNDVSPGAVFTVTAPVVTFSAQPASQTAASGASVTLSATTGQGTYQWQRNGTNIATATNASLALANLRPDDAGLYRAVVTSGNDTGASAFAIVGVASPTKVIGAGLVAGDNITHPNGNVFDQVLVTGTAEAITAEPGKITRTSFIDLNDDIVQVEFSGTGTLSLVLDGVSGRAAPVKYNQPGVLYARGHAGIVVTGANETTNLSIFTVGRATAFDPTGAYDFLKAPGPTNNPANNGSSLFQGQANTTYDGVADLAYVAISSTNGKFGGLRAANAHFFALAGITGLYAPGVAFQGPVFIGNIDAMDAAMPALIVGSAADVRITGGDLTQTNGSAVQVAGLTQLQFTAGIDSQGRELSAKANRAVLQQDGQNLSAQLVRSGTATVNPSAFSFIDVIDAEPGTTFTSNAITVSGISSTTAAAISITGGTYSVNGGAYSSAAGTVKGGDMVTVRHVSSANVSTRTSARLTIAGVSDAFDVTTRAGAALSYSILAGADAHGSISPSGTSAVTAGGSLTLFAFPDSGWKVGQWLVNGTIVALSGSSYTLSNISANATVQVRFESLTAIGTRLTSGATVTGVLGSGETATWSIEVERADAFVVRVGELSGTAGFVPKVQLFTPTGGLLVTNTSDGDAMITYKAFTPGIYGIAVSSQSTSDSGSYRITMVKVPGPYTVPAGDEGGLLRANTPRDATITMGDLDAWTLDTSTDEQLLLQLDKLGGDAGFTPSVTIYNSEGNVVVSGGGQQSLSLSFAGGLYTVVVGSQTPGQTGTYRIRY